MQRLIIPPQEANRLTRVQQFVEQKAQRQKNRGTLRDKRCEATLFITSKSKKGDTTAVVIFAKRPESTKKKKEKK